MFLDNDFYNFTMGEFIWKNFPDVNVTYAFKNRSDVKLEEYLSNFRAKLDNTLAEMTPRAEECSYLSGLGIFDPEYISWLCEYSPVEPQVEFVDGDLQLTYSGPWAQTVFMETPILCAVKAQFTDILGENRTKMLDNLQNKIDFLQKRPYLRFIEFGTRRRSSWLAQRDILHSLVEALPSQLLGTSNTAFARDFGIQPYGTMAHQLYMVLTALYYDPHTAQDLVLSMWDRHWNGAMSMTLPDTYTTSFFLSGLTRSQAEKWNFRQDSGDPFKVCAQIIEFWKDNGIDPKTKKIIPSDGLNVQLMDDLYSAFGHLTNMEFGIGTNLTDDCGNPPLSIVIKPIAANGSPCVKLSDNLNKATGDPLEISRIMSYLPDVQVKEFQNGGMAVMY